MNKDDLLYHYFANSLTKVQREQFKNLLDTDVEFKNRFEYENNIKRVIKEKRYLDIKTKLNTFESEIKKKKKALTTSNFSYWKIAASIVFLLSTGWFGYHSFFGLNYDDLYNDNFKTYPNTVYTIKRGDSINSLEREAFMAYEAGKYDIAIQKFNEADLKDYFSFYKAQSYMSLNNTEEAEHLFKKVIKDRNQFVAETYWYLALIQIKEKNKELAYKYLNILIDHHTYNSEKAKILLDKLE